LVYVTLLYDQLCSGPHFQVVNGLGHANASMAPFDFVSGGLCHGDCHECAAGQLPKRCRLIDSVQPGKVERLAHFIQTVTSGHVDIAYVNQGYSWDRAADAAATHGIMLEVVKLPEANHGFVLLPRRWVVERSFAWATRFRRLVKDYERYAQMLAGLHLTAFARIMMEQAATIASHPRSNR